uniref:hypothetical protein n=1 Tax=Clostridium sp. NkU-1 TaxID=1095009 RepID=UPI0006D055C6
MRRTETILMGKKIILEGSGSDEYVKAMLEHFAKQVDNQIHTELVSEIMERYVVVSKQLEIKSRELEKKRCFPPGSPGNRADQQLGAESLHKAAMVVGHHEQDIGNRPVR